MENAIVGCILGTAVGDALGLPTEGLSKARLARLYPRPDRHHFLLGRGMVSDDTEHACMVAQALISSAGDVEKFRQSLARQLKFWLLGLPAGVGLATAKAILKLWLGFGPDASGVLSAGNGPCMRSAIIGVFCGDDTEKLRALVGASTRFTHTDPRAEFGALAVALAASMASRESPGIPASDHYCEELRALLAGQGQELLELVTRAAESAVAGRSTQSFAADLGLVSGVGGYVYDTVPVVLHAWFRHRDDYRSAILDVIGCGGDTDTAAAILGGIIGTYVGENRIPKEWGEKLSEWPRTVRWMRELGERLAAVATTGRPERMLSLSYPAVLLRNLLFLAVVLLHGLRRLLPPY